MSRGAIVRRIEDVPEDLLPGAHVVLLSSDPTDGIGGRRFGLELRDTVLVLAPGGASFAFLLRKGLEGTVAENVLRHGTGALNIDGTRVRYTKGEVDFDKQQRQQQCAGTIKNGFGAATLIGKEIPLYKPEGRWPSNLVLVHGAGCERTGTKTVAAPVINRFTNDIKPFGQGAGHPYVSTGGGTEEVAVWTCAEGCPVANLDEQSGEGVSKRAPRGRGMGYDDDGAQRARDGVDVVGRGHNDSGGASRFFPQFESDDAFLAWLTRLIGLAV